MPLTHQQAVCFSRYNFANILHSLTNCVSVLTPPVPSSAPLPALLPIAVLMTVVVPVPAPAFSSSSSSSSSSCKSSVAGSQSDSPLSLSQPLPLPPPSAFSAAHRALQAACRVQRREQQKQN